MPRVRYAALCAECNKGDSSTTAAHSSSYGRCSLAAKWTWAETVRCFGVNWLGFHRRISLAAPSWSKEILRAPGKAHIVD